MKYQDKIDNMTVYGLKLKLQEVHMSQIKETITQLENLKEHCEAMQAIENRTCYRMYIAAIDTAIAIMRKDDGNEY